MANLPKPLRREQIMREALAMAHKQGFEAITCHEVARRCKCAYRTVQRQYRNRLILLESLVKYAELVGDGQIVATGKRLLDEKD